MYFKKCLKPRLDQKSIIYTYNIYFKYKNLSTIVIDLTHSGPALLYSSLIARTGIISCDKKALQKSVLGRNCKLTTGERKGGGDCCVRKRRKKARRNSELKEKKEKVTERNETE